jgi:hypothetical protein
MTASSNSAQLRNRPASHETSPEMYANMLPATLRSGKINR